MKRAADEADILKPLTAHLTDDNDWPIFQLSNASVADPTTDTPQNLLFANENTPLTVSGRLERLDRSEQHHLIDRDALPCPVQVQSVERFSYGQYDSGEVAFWAAGKAGWFEIKPARPYKDIYKDMTEAINILYFAADFFRSRKSKQARRVGVDVVFAKYAEEPDNKCATEARARSAFLKHRNVLLCLMGQGKEGIRWDKTSIYDFLARESSDSPAAQVATPKATPDHASDDDDLPARLAGKGKSALRLKPSSQSSKGAARQEALLAAVDEDGDIDMQSPDGRPPSPLKRKSAQEISTRPLKRSTRRRRNEEETADDTNTMPPIPDEPSDAPIHLPLRPPTKAGRKPGPVHPTLELTLVETPLPSFAANLPGDIWACPTPGCVHKIYAASDPASHDLISEHYRAHAYASQAAIDLVQKEERPYLPVGNLIKRIRDMAARQAIPAAAMDVTNAAGQGRASMMSRKDSGGWMGPQEALPKAIRQKY